MKVLLAVNNSNNPIETARYLADRFGKSPIELHLLSVISGQEIISKTMVNNSDHEAKLEKQALCHRETSTMLADFARHIRFTGKVKSISTYVEYGDPAEVMLSMCRQLQVDIVLLGAPKKHGFLTAFRLDGVTRRVMRWTECTVEMFRCCNSENVQQRILVPLRIEPGRQLTLPPIQHLALGTNCDIRLLGILPQVFEDNQVEANPAAMLIRIQETRDRWGFARSKLEELGKQLAGELPESTRVSQLLLQGNPVEVLAQSARELTPTHVVLDEKWVARKGHIFPDLSPMTVIMSMNCSVISLGQERKTGEQQQIYGSSGLAY